MPTRRWLLAAAIAHGCFAQQQTGAPPGVPVPAAPISPSSGTAGASPGSRVFQVRVIDGRNGAPVNRARISLWYDEANGDGVMLQSNERGIATMPAPVGLPVRVLVMPRQLVDCRRTPRDAPPSGYNMQAVAAHGIGGENTCGDVAVKPGPGELVLYVRPMRWYEGLNP